MAEVGYIFPEDAAKQVVEVGNAIKETDDQLIAYTKTTENLIAILKDQNISFSQLQNAQKQAQSLTRYLDQVSKKMVQTEYQLTGIEKERIKIKEQQKNILVKNLVVEEKSNIILQKGKLLLQQKTQALKDKLKANQAEEGSLVKMRLKLKELTAEYDRSGTRTKAAASEINKLSKEIGKAEEATNRNQRSVGRYGKVWDGLKSMLPIMSIAAVGTAIVETAKKVINSTDTLSTKFAVFMGGMKGATDEFIRTLATGDWSNFTENMKNAIAVGREYESVLDAIEAKQRALTIIEADYREEIVKTEEDLKNVGLTNAERKTAGEKRIQIEKEISTYRTKLATDTYNNELSVAMQSSKLREDELIELARDFDSEKKLRAEKLLELQAELKREESKQAKGGASTGVLYPGMQSSVSNSSKINKLKQQIAGFNPVVQNYAKALSQLGNATDEQLNKVAEAYSNLKGAEQSGREGINRVITMVNSLSAAEKKAGKTETTNKEQSSLFKIDQAIDEPISKFAIDNAQKEAEILAEKKASEEEWTAFMKKQVEERMDASQQELEKEKQNLEFDKELTEARKQLKGEYMNAIGQVAGALSSMFKEGSAAQIAALAIEKGAAIAQIIFQTAVANAKATAVSPLTLGQPWVTINTISAAASIASIIGTTISQFKDKKNNGIPGFATGTEYAPSEFVAGEAGRELIKTKSGDVVMADKTTHFKGNRFKGATVYTNRETEQIIKESGKSNSFVFDTSDLRDEMRAVKNAINKKPIAITDNSGRIVGSQSNNYRETYLNRMRNGR